MARSMTHNWGPQDERGALNLIDRSATLRGIASVQTGEVLELGIEIVGGSRGPASPIRPPAQHYMLRHGGDYAAGLPEQNGFGFSDDVIHLATHGTTHIDALAHVWCGGEMYNGFSSNKVTSKGAKHLGVDKLGPIVTRGIFLDLAPSNEVEQGYPIRCDQLQAAAKNADIKPEPGDALIIRSGWMKAWRDGQADASTSTGLHHDCADWIISSGFALVAADNVAVEVLPSQDPDCAVPLHLALIRDNGIPLAELLDLERLAATGRTTFMLSIAPLKIKGGVGSPIMPIAIL